MPLSVRDVLEADSVRQKPRVKALGSEREIAALLRVEDLGRAGIGTALSEAAGIAFRAYAADHGELLRWSSVWIGVLAVAGVSASLGAAVAAWASHALVFVSPVPLGEFGLVAALAGAFLSQLLAYLLQLMRAVTNGRATHARGPMHGALVSLISCVAYGCQLGLLLWLPRSAQARLVVQGA